MCSLTFFDTGLYSVLKQKPKKHFPCEFIAVVFKPGNSIIICLPPLGRLITINFFHTFSFRPGIFFSVDR